VFVRCFLRCLLVFRLSTRLVGSNWHIYFNSLQIWWRFECQCCRSGSMDIPVTFVLSYLWALSSCCCMLLTYVLQDCLQIHIFSVFSNLEFLMIYVFFNLNEWISFLVKKNVLRKRKYSICKYIYVCCKDNNILKIFLNVENVENYDFRETKSSSNHLNVEFGLIECWSNVMRSYSIVTKVNSFVTIISKW
jgi:hypothetical protein